MLARATPLDASFLHLETPSAHMHVAWRGRFRLAPGRPRPSVDALRASIASRLHLLPRFRQRLQFAPAGLAPPAWVDDPDFDVAAHVSLLGPGAALSTERFAALADAALSRPLDRRRPLWHVALAPDLEGGDVGLLVKMHHALVDGKSAVAVGMLLFDVVPDAPPLDAPAWHPAPAPGPARQALSFVADGAASPVRAGRALAGLRTLPLGALTEDVLRPAPPSPLNVAIGPRRTLVAHRLPLEDVLRIKRRHGVTHNDVCLAVVAGALRELSLRRRRPPTALKVMVPVNVRGEDEHDALGNRISFAFIDLPLHLASARLRLRFIHAATARLKRSGRPAAVGGLLGVAELVPPVLRGALARSLAGPRAYNLVVSNVPGPSQPLYMLGAELREAYPVVPLSEGHGLSIGLFTYRDGVHVGCYADPDAVPDAAALPAALDRATAALDPRMIPRPRTRARTARGALRQAAASASG